MNTTRSPLWIQIMRTDKNKFKEFILNGNTVKLVKVCVLPSNTTCPNAYSNIKCAECEHYRQTE